MGQYYKVYTVDAYGNEHVYSTHTSVFMAAHHIGNPEKVKEHPKYHVYDYDDPDSWGALSSGCKLMEHSWMRNDFVNGIVEELHDNPQAVAWVGDYADAPGDFEDVDRYSEEVYRKVWCDDGLPDSPFPARPDIRERGYLLNHTKWEYIDLEKYRELAGFAPAWDKGGTWCIHPLPLLTAIGNDRGGGDYRSCYPNIENVGSWAMDTIEYRTEPPAGFFSEVDYNKIIFKEER